MSCNKCGKCCEQFVFSVFNKIDQDYLKSEILSGKGAKPRGPSRQLGLSMIDTFWLAFFIKAKNPDEYLTDWECRLFHPAVGCILQHFFGANFKPITCKVHGEIDLGTLHDECGYVTDDYRYDKKTMSWSKRP